ncbi:molybdenum cofactor sulfurtransferase [Salvia divinorum]|uniref:Molybdenum cofactor sulfurtransferase n=1 Tax=Salvia divinorum TaxID=28513 RepID=A0ABD1I3E5_SALDI
MSPNSIDDDDYLSNGECEEQELERGEIICKHLDHINMLGLNKTISQLRFLINWLVHIYGPWIKYERGAAVAFNVRDRSRGLISPEVVQKLAESHGISLGIGILCHIRNIEGSKLCGPLSLEDTTLCKPMANGGKSGFIKVEGVTASLAFLSNFDDVYKLWAFVAKFVDPNFVKEGVLPFVVEECEE